MCFYCMILILKNGSLVELLCPNTLVLYTKYPSLSVNNILYSLAHCTTALECVHE